MFEQIQIVSFIFAAGSSAGWLLEVIYRHFFPSIGQTSRWVNPGFLAGPCNPLYGTGLAILYGLSFITFPGMDPDGFWTKVLVLLIMTAVMTVVELVTGWIFIIRMNVRLWDYSDNRFNYKGIICPLYTFFWGLICAIYYLFVHNFFLSFLPKIISTQYFALAMIIYYTIFAIDLLYSFKILRLIRNLAREYNIIVLFNIFRSKLGDLRGEFKEKSKFFRPMELKSISMREAFVRYKDAISFARWKERLARMRRGGHSDGDASES